MDLSYFMKTSLNGAFVEAQRKKVEFLTPESVMLYMVENSTLFRIIMNNTSRHLRNLSSILRSYLDLNDELLDEDDETTVSPQLMEVLNEATDRASSAEVKIVDVPHFLAAIMNLKDSFLGNYLKKEDGTGASVLASLNTGENRKLLYAINNPEVIKKDRDADELRQEPAAKWNQEFDLDSENEEYDASDKQKTMEMEVPDGITLLNDICSSRQLIGREEEIDRTIQILCRMEKNNPLHVGEPGVGKTCLVYGLTKRIVEGNVPENLQNAKVFMFDISSVMSGTAYRGELEKRLSNMLEYVSSSCPNPIIYIDEIHNIMGAGRIGDGSLDVANILKPYLEQGTIRFIGSTTYDEYNRHMTKSKSIIRRFQLVDLDEPSVEETEKILEGLKPKFEDFHKVVYAPDMMRYAAESSAKYIHDRFLPDKAIDLIDEAGAYRQLHPLTNQNPKSKFYGTTKRVKQVVDKQLIDEMLAKICKVKAEALKDNDNSLLFDLSERIQKRIYGQDEAVKQVSMAVQMSKAGLLDDGKPLASLLFVGPTGVGKTELAKVLAEELGVELVRFDMSEFAEKHTVSKLIGSPAGYVGYDDGGLLTDAIRKSPNCVLLLDEIEKAHPDIFNILLQVMDYARLTDNKGQKANFRNVVLIMTSNAGAQYASQASVGFASHVTAGQAMLQQVKKVFKPEFINRLSGTVVFNDLSLDMARRVLDKKIGQLQSRLNARNVKLHLSDEAIALLLKLGYNKANGAREMDRIINNHLNPLLMEAILYGKLQKGGDADITVNNDNKLRIN